MGSRHQPEKTAGIADGAGLKIQRRNMTLKALEEEGEKEGEREEGEKEGEGEREEKESFRVGGGEERMRGR